MLPLSRLVLPVGAGLGHRPQGGIGVRLHLHLLLLWLGVQLHAVPLPVHVIVVPGGAWLLLPGMLLEVASGVRPGVAVQVLCSGRTWGSLLSSLVGLLFFVSSAYDL